MFTKLHQTLLQVHLFYGRWGVGARSQHDPAACKKSILHRADKYWTGIGWEIQMMILDKYEFNLKTNTELGWRGKYKWWYWTNMNLNWRQILNWDSMGNTNDDTGQIGILPADKYWTRIGWEIQMMILNKYELNG